MRPLRAPNISPKLLTEGALGIRTRDRERETRMAQQIAPRRAEIVGLILDRTPSKAPFPAKISRGDNTVM